MKKKMNNIFKILNKEETQSIKGKGNGNAYGNGTGKGLAKGWNNAWMKGEGDYNRLFDKEIGYCPPPEPDNELSIHIR